MDKQEACPCLCELCLIANPLDVPKGDTKHDGNHGQVNSSNQVYNQGLEAGLLGLLNVHEHLLDEAHDLIHD